MEQLDKFDTNTCAVNCFDEEFRRIEASLYQVLRRTTANEPQRAVQQTTEKMGFETWHAIVRRYGHRNMSDKNSAHAVLISNISEKDTAKDVKQFDDILRTFINNTNIENRFAMIRDEEKMLAVRKLMPESLLNCRFRGTTLSCSELLVSLENIIIDKVATVSTVRIRKVGTSAPMETGMATEDNRETIREEDQRIVNLALRAVYKGTGEGKCEFGQGQSWNGKGYHGGKGGKDGGKNSWQKGSGKKKQQGTRKRWQERNQSLLDMWKNRAHSSMVSACG